MLGDSNAFKAPPPAELEIRIMALTQTPPPMARIVHISSLYAPDVIGGAERVVEMLAEGQAALGHEVSVICTSKEPRAPVIRNGVTVYAIGNYNHLWIEDVQRAQPFDKAFNKLEISFGEPGVAKIDELLNQIRPEFIHTHSMVEISPAAWKLARKLGATNIHTLHDYDMICRRATMFKGAACKAQHTVCKLLSLKKVHYSKYIDGIVAVSSPVLAQHDKYTNTLRIPPSRRRVIWNASNLAVQENVPRVIIPDDAFQGITFGFLGRLVPEKGIDLLIDACKAIQQRPNWRLLVGGKHPSDDQHYKIMAQGLPVSFLGFVDPAEFLSKVDVLIVPSLWAEPFGLTVIEAIASGVNVIGSDAGAIPEILTHALQQDAKNWIFPAGDLGSLVGIMGNILVNGRDALPGSDRFSALLQELKPASMASAYLSFYNQVKEEVGNSQ